MSTYGTAFSETEALLAVQAAIDDEDDEDFAEAQAILDEMLPGELRRLADAARTLERLCRATYRGKR